MDIFDRSNPTVIFTEFGDDSIPREPKLLYVFQYKEPDGTTDYNLPYPNLVEDRPGAGTIIGVILDTGGYPQTNSIIGRSRLANYLSIGGVKLPKGETAESIIDRALPIDLRDWNKHFTHDRLNKGFSVLALS